MKEAMFLYDGFRPYVPKGKLAEFDKEFQGRKRYTVKFMTELITQNVDLEYYYKNPKDPNDGYLFNFFLFEFSERNSELTKALKEFRDTPTTAERKFLF